MTKVMISVPEQFLDKIDNLANSENCTRSELIREALRTYIDKQNIKNAYISNPIIKGEI